MPKYLSGRVKRVANSDLKSDRYTYLSLEQAEPNPSDPQSLGIADGASSTDFPVGTKYQVFSVYGDPNPGTRYWQPVGGGIIPGSISVFDEGTVVGGSNSITSLNFEGVAIAATATPPGTGVAATITVAPPGHSGQLLFNLKVGTGITDFSTSDNLVFDPNVGIFTSKTHVHVGLGGSIFSAFSGTSEGVGVASVGIGTSDPTATLHVKGDLRLEGTIYDGDNEPGTAGDLIVKANDGTLEWKDPKLVNAGAGGYITNVQYHDDTGLIDGASNFVWVEPKVVGAAGSVGIGSTQPIVLFEVLGNSKLTGVTTFVGKIHFDNADDAGKDIEWQPTNDRLSFMDNVQATFGNGADLQIYHSGAHSFIEDTNQGNLVLKGSRVDIQDTDGNELLLAEGGSYVRLSYGADERFTTTGVGASAVGIMSASQSFISPELYINPSGIGTIGNVKISGNTVNTTVGALTLDSNSGTITTPDLLTVTNSTDSTSVDSGALQVDGGIGINKNIHGGGSLRILGYPAGDPVTYPYDFRTSGNPPSGQVQFDQGSYTTATTLKIHKTDRTNNDHPALYAVLRLGDTVKIINDTDTSKSILYKLTGDSTVSGDVYTFPISYLEGTWSEALQGTDVDVVIDQVGEGSVSLASAGGITTTGGDLYIGGDLFVQDDIFLDEGNFQKLIVKPGPPGTGVSTFWGDINVGVGNTAAFIDAGLSRVGIGTSVPSQELHLFNQHGDVTLRLESYEVNKDTQIELFHRNLRKWSIINDSSNTHQLEIQGDGGSSDKFFIIKQDGYIGIGEENPSYILDIKGKTGVNATLQLRNDGTQASDHTVIRNKIDSVSASNYIYFGDNDDDDVGIIEYDHGENSLKFTVNTGEYLTVESTGIVTSKGQTLFSKQLNVLGFSTFVGILTVHDTLFSKQFSTGISTLGIGTADTLYISGISTFAGITTVTGDTLFTKQLNVLGFSTFHDTVHLIGGLKDKDGQLGDNGQLLESRDNKTNWVDAGDLTVQNATKVGVGTTNSVVEDVPSTVSYYPTFVNSNNNQSRENEFLYSDIGLTYSLSYKDGIGIGSVGIGTSNPLHMLDVRGNVAFGYQQTTGNPGTNIGIATIRGHHVNSDSDYAHLYLANSESSGGSTASIRAARDGDNYGTNLSFWTNGSGSAGNGLERLRIDANGDINLGNNPTNQYGYKLNIQDSAIIYAQTASSGGLEAKWHLDNSAQLMEFGTVTTDDLSLVTTNIRRLTIDSNGNFIVSAATGISTFVGGLHATGVGVSIADGGLDVNPLGISTLPNLDTRFINDINHYLEIGDFGQVLHNTTNVNPLEIWDPLVIEGSYIPKHGEIIKIVFSQDDKPTRQLIYRYNANLTNNPGVGEITSYYGVPANVSTNFNNSNAKLVFNKTALPGSYNTVLYAANGSGALDGYSFGHASFRITFSAHVDISRRVGIGTSVPTDPQGTDRGGFLGVAGIVTAYNMYADKFYGPIEGTITPTGDIDIQEWIKHVGNTNTKFGFPENNVFAVHTNNAERFRIKSDGSMSAGGTPLTTSDIYWTPDTNQRAYIFSGLTGGSPGDGVFVAASPVSDPTSQRIGAFAFGCKTSTSDGVTNAGLKAIIEGWTKSSPGNDWKAGSEISFSTRPDNGNLTEALRIHSGGQVTVGTPNDNLSDIFTIVDPGNAFMSLRSDAEADGNSQIIDFAVGTDNRSSSNLVSSITSTIPAGAAAGGTLKGYLAFSTNAGDNLTEKLRIKPDGDILYSAPSGMTSITSKRTDTNANNGDGWFELKVTSGDDTEIGKLGFYRDTNTDDAHFTIKARDTGGSNEERFRITSEGHVGIGTTNPIYGIDGTGIGGDTIKEALESNTRVLAVGIVTANEYFGTFKGTIGDDVTLDTAAKANKIKAQTTSSNAAHYLTFVNSTGTGYKDVYVNTGISYTPDVYDDDTDRGTLTITGNLSIGGTVTYEDVTNVDSLGIITARTGLHVLENGIDVKSGVSTFKDGVETVSVGSTINYLNLSKGYCVARGFTQADENVAHLSYWKPIAGFTPKGNYVPVDGELIQFTFSHPDKLNGVPRTFVFEYTSSPGDYGSSFNGKCTIHNPTNSVYEYNQMSTTQGIWRFDYNAKPGGYSTNFKVDGFDEFASVDSTGDDKFKIEVGSLVSVNNSVGIGTSSLHDPQTTDRGAYLAVAGIATAYEMYATKFYGPIEGALSPTGDFDIEQWIKHVGDDDTKFGFPTSTTDSPNGNTFAVHTGGSERFRINDAGITSVRGADDTDNFVVDVDGTEFAIHTDSSDGEISLRAQDENGSTNPKYMTFYTQKTGEVSKERLRIEEDGKVGVNQTDWDNKNHMFEVKQSTNDKEIARFAVDGSGGTTVGKGFIGLTPFLNTVYPHVSIGVEEAGQANYQGHLTFATRNTTNDSAPVERMRIDSSGTAIVHKGIETVSIGATNSGNILRLQDSTTAASCITGDFSNSNPYTSGGSNVGISIWKPQNPVKGSYKPVAGELIRFTFTQSGKETRTFVWEYDAGTFPTAAKCALYTNSVTNYNEVTSTADTIRWQFNYTAHSDGYSTNFLTDGINYYGSDLKDDGLSVEVGTVVSIMSAVGIGTSVPSDPQSSVDRGAILAVAGIVTAYNMYADKFYGPIEGAVTPTGDLNIEQWIKHVGDDDTKFGFPEDNVFAVNTNNAEALRIDSSQRLLLGTTAYRQNLNSSADTSGQLAQFVGVADNVNQCIGVFAYAGTTNVTERGAKLQLHRTRATDLTDNTAVAENDLIGSLEFKGNDGTSFSPAARIDAYVDGGVGTDDMPGRLSFWTTNEGTAVPKERMRITENGAVVVAGNTTYSDNTFGEGKLQFNTKKNSHIGATSVADTNDSISHLLFKNQQGPVGSIGTHDDDLLISTKGSAANNIERLRFTYEGHVYPGADDVQDLGKSATEKRWNNIYAKNVYAENLSSGGGTSPTDSVFTSTGSINGTDQKIDDTADTNSLLEYTIFFSLDATPANMQSQKILIMSNGTNAYMQEYAIMFNDKRLVTLSVVNTGGGNKTELRGTTLISQVTYKLSRRTVT